MALALQQQYSAMPRRSTPPQPAPADWPLDKTYEALKKQLAALERLRGRNFREADNDEAKWENLTLIILTHGFGENNSNVSEFYHARSTGEHYIPSGGTNESLLQQNFENRIEAYADVLRGSIAELELILTEPEVTDQNESGDQYQFDSDLKTIVGFATGELFIIDDCLDTHLFDVYMANVSPATAIRVLTNQVGDSLRIVAEQFAKRGKFELRSSKDARDRVIFADYSCWVIAQSIASVEHSGVGAMKGIYEPIWANATSIVKS